MPPTEVTTHPSTGSDTRRHLLDAAERLIGDQGVDRASVRSITELAGANLAAVSYHFGSKDGLVREVFERRLRPINRERIRLLEDCLEPDGPPDLERVVRAFVGPPFQLLRGNQAASFGRCMVRVLSDPGDETRDLLMEVFDEVIKRFAGALQLALPDAKPEGIFWRFHFMIGSMAYTVGMGHLVPEYSRGICSTQDVEAMTERLVRFITAGMRAESEVQRP
jgi:AcrR family transcriptional regulator